MSNIFDTAKYILEQCGEMSTMKLQKLCYYAQAWSLVWDDKPLFQNDFMAWRTGPVCEELFYRTREKYTVNVSDVYGGNDDLTDDQKASINIVIKHYGEHDGQWLGRLSCMERPWKIAIVDSPNIGIITKDSMAIYYGGLD